ncbi:MAG: hypothetical protein M3P28_03625 [Thermoproteota archaeon]|nr:hypothetical protein [Thermoproteota archaeon]
MSDNINAIENNKLNSEELIDLRDKVDLLLEQHEATQKAICHLRGDLPSIVKLVISEILKKHARCSIL